MCLRGSNGSTTICSVPLISALQKLFRVEGVQVQVSVSFGKTQINIAILILNEIFTCKMDSHLLRLQNPEKVWRVIKENRDNWTHLPSCETGSAEKVTTRLDPDVFAVLGADFTQLQQENNSNPLDKTYRWKVKTVPLHHIHVAGCLEAVVNFISSEISSSTVSPRHNLTMPQSHLEGAAHLTVELVLLLCHLHVILGSRLYTEECDFTKGALLSLNFNLSVIPCICSFQWSTVTLKWWYNDLNCPGKVRVDTPSIGIEVAEKIVWVSLILWYFYWPTNFEAWFRNLQSLPVAIQKGLAQRLVLKCEVSKHLPMSF